MPSSRDCGKRPGGYPVTTESDRQWKAGWGTWTALAIAGVYGFVGALWIGYSDQFVASLELSADQFTRAQQYKGWGYVLVTASLLFLILRHLFTRLDRTYRAVRRSRDRLASLNRLYRMIRAVKGAMLRVREPEVLLQEACRVAVAEGGYLTAWVALWDPDRRHIRAAAHAGTGRSLIASLVLSSDRVRTLRKSPLATAAVEGRSCFRANLDPDPALDRNGVGDGRLGYAAAAALPLRVDGRTEGALVVYARQVDAFDDPGEQALLGEIVDSLALGLGYLRRGHALDELVHYDTVTGLPNRTLLEERITHAFARSQQTDCAVALVVLDIDDFSRINHTGGRETGDHVLRSVAQVLTASLRPGDTVARLGNDEFALLFVDLPSPQDAGVPVNRTSDCFPQQLEIGGQETFLGVSMGVAVHPVDAVTADDLLTRAELALHSRPRDQAGTVIYYEPGLNERAQHRRRLELALRTALERDEFHLVWQPIIALNDRDLCGAEVLLRWTHAELGPVAPATFIPLAEQSGLIVGIGDWVLRQACRQAAEWTAGRDRSGAGTLEVHINLAVQQLQHPGFVDRVRALLEETGHSGWQLVLELTESEFMQDTAATAATCHELKRLGCALYVDDFGTGYSALNYLTRLPLDGLKIDRSFVVQAAERADARAIVRAVVPLANELGLRIVAEGVETAAQYDMMRTLGCHRVQGYLPGRPVRAEAFAAGFLQPGDASRASA